MEYIVFGGMNTDLEKGLTKEQAISVATRYALSGLSVCVEIHSAAGDLRYLNPDGSIGECCRMWTRDAVTSQQRNEVHQAS